MSASTPTRPMPMLGTTLDLQRHRPARWPDHRPGDGCHQWHAQLVQLGHPQRDHHRHRRHADRHRQLHLDGRQRQPGTGFSTDITDQTDAEGDSVSLDADATDPDLDTLPTRPPACPAGVSINAIDGCHQWHARLRRSSGTHNVTITVRDGTAVDDTDTFTWTVTNTNQAPVFSTDITDQTDAEGDSRQPRRRRDRCRPRHADLQRAEPARGRDHQRRARVSSAAPSPTPRRAPTS